MEKRTFKTWTPDELDWLKRHYTTKSNAAIAKHFNCNVQRVKAKLYTLGLRRHKRHQFTIGEINWIEANYSKLTAAEIAQHLNCDKVGVWCIAQKLGITNKYHKWTPDELKWIDAHRATMTYREMALHLGVKIQSLGAHVRKLKKQ